MENEIKNIEEIGKNIINAAIKVHRSLGPGLLESVYQKCLHYELKKLKIKAACEVSCPIKYEEIFIETGFRLDMIVEDCIIIENKTVQQILPIHEAQLLSYLKLKDCRLGFIFNWKSVLLKDGIKRMVNDI